MMRTIAATLVLRLGAAGLLLAGGPALAQQLGGGADTGLGWWRVMLLLLFLAAIAATGLYLVKRGGGTLRLWQPQGERRLRVAELVRLSPQAGLCLATLDDEEFLIAFSASGATLIEKRPAKPSGIAA